MDEMNIAAIKEDFRVWSGGFPPDSEQEIFVYVETAAPVDADTKAVLHVLRDWMANATDSVNLDL